METYKEQLNKQIKEIQEKYPASIQLLREIKQADNADEAHIDYKEERTIMYYKAIEKFVNSLTPQTGVKP